MPHGVFRAYRGEKNNVQPQNIATGVSVTHLKGQEGVVLARTFKHSIALTLMLGVLVVLQQYVVEWMIP